MNKPLIKCTKWVNGKVEYETYLLLVEESVKQLCEVENVHSYNVEEREFYAPNDTVFTIVSTDEIRFSRIVKLMGERGILFV